jgi:SMODS-associated and fused to various effectors sensor domain
MNIFDKARTALTEARFDDTFSLLDQAEVDSYLLSQFKQEYMQGANHTFTQRLTILINEEEKKAKAKKQELLELFKKIAKESQLSLHDGETISFRGELLEISFNEPKNHVYTLSNQLIVSIRAGRPIQGGVYDKYKDQKCSFFHIQKRENPENIDIQYPEHWEKFVKETNRFLNHLLQQVKSPEVHLFLGMPIALAAGIGAAIGTYYAISLYHFQENEYCKVLTLNQDLRK